MPTDYVIPKPLWIRCDLRDKPFLNAWRGVGQAFHTDVRSECPTDDKPQFIPYPSHHLAGRRLFLTHHLQWGFVGVLVEVPDIVNALSDHCETGQKVAPRFVKRRSPHRQPRFLSPHLQGGARGGVGRSLGHRECVFPFSVVGRGSLTPPECLTFRSPSFGVCSECANAFEQGPTMSEGDLRSGASNIGKRSARRRRPSTTPNKNTGCPTALLSSPNFSPRHLRPPKRNPNLPQDGLRAPPSLGGQCPPKSLPIAAPAASLTSCPRSASHPKASLSGPATPGR